MFLSLNKEEIIGHWSQMFNVKKVYYGLFNE